MRFDLQLKKELALIQHACSRDETRPNLAAVRVDCLSGPVRLSVTDGHRIAQIESAVLAGAVCEDGVKVIPGPLVKALLKVQRKGGEVEVRFEGAEDYPKLEQITKHADLYRVGMLLRPAQAVARLRQIAAAGSTEAVAMTLQDGRLSFAAEIHEPDDVNEDRFDLVAQTSTEFDLDKAFAGKIGVNARYLADAIDLAKGSVILSVCTDEPEKRVLRIVGHSGTSYIMPCRL